MAVNLIKYIRSVLIKNLQTANYFFCLLFVQCICSFKPQSQFDNNISHRDNISHSDSFRLDRIQLWDYECVRKSA